MITRFSGYFQRSGPDQSAMKSRITDKAHGCCAATTSHSALGVYNAPSCQGAYFSMDLDKLRTVTILVLLVGCFVAGCATPDPATTAVPSNYRLLVAGYLASKWDKRKILKAEISRPGDWVGPFGLGGPRPIACVQLTIQGPLIQQTLAMGFTFENGQIAEVFNPDEINPAAGGAFAAAVKNAATCGKLAYSPFPELVKASPR